MNKGELAFFGSTYRLSSGSIWFYNPNRVEPILNITLETQAKGVTVVLSVSGAVDNMKLSYTSDPPLQFEEIVALLAAGKPPTSDPTLLANQPSQPEQTFQQRGETALVSKALADPLSQSAPAGIWSEPVEDRPEFHQRLAAAASARDPSAAGIFEAPLHLRYGAGQSEHPDCSH
jgi:hypothetical protein